MKSWKHALLIISLLLFSACGSGGGNTIQIGSARPSTNYYSIAEAIAEIGANKNPNVTFEVAESSGSEENIRNVSSGRIQFGIAQADVLYDAVNAEGLFEDEPKMNHLRAVAGLYPEAIQIITRKDREMYTVPGLWGATIGVGDSHSGTEQNAFFILRAANLNENLVTTQNLSVSDACQALKDGAIDAFFYTSGAPSALIEELANEIEISLIPIDGELLNVLLEEHPYFEEYVIPSGTYVGQNEDIQTISIESVLITSDQESDETVQQFTEDLFANRKQIEDSIKLQFTFDEPTAVNHIPVPFHNGAKAYYQSKGIDVQ